MSNLQREPTKFRIEIVDVGENQHQGRIISDAGITLAETAPQRFSVDALQLIGKFIASIPIDVLHSVKYGNPFSVRDHIKIRSILGWKRD